MRKLEEHFCTYEQEEQLINLGFDHHQKVYVTDQETNYIILRTQALDFFRDKGLDFHISGYLSKGFWFGCYKNNEAYCSPNFKLYPEAESALIDKLIELEMGVQNGKQ